MQSTRCIDQPVLTEVQIVPIKPTDGIVGFASFVLNDWLYLGSIAIMSRPNGEFRLLYPTKKVGTTKLDIFHPITREFGQQVEEVVIGKFKEVMKQGSRDGAESDY